jgi:hypothetical protein
MPGVDIGRSGFVLFTLGCGCTPSQAYCHPAGMCSQTPIRRTGWRWLFTLGCECTPISVLLPPCRRVQSDTRQSDRLAVAVLRLPEGGPAPCGRLARGGAGAAARKRRPGGRLAAAVAPAGAARSGLSSRMRKPLSSSCAREASGVRACDVCASQGSWGQPQAGQARWPTQEARLPGIRAQEAVWVPVGSRWRARAKAQQQVGTRSRRARRAMAVAPPSKVASQGPFATEKADASHSVGVQSDDMAAEGGGAPAALRRATAGSRGPRSAARPPRSPAAAARPAARSSGTARATC